MGSNRFRGFGFARGCVGDQIRHGRSGDIPCRNVGLAVLFAPDCDGKDLSSRTAQREPGRFAAEPDGNYRLPLGLQRGDLVDAHDVAQTPDAEVRPDARGPVDIGFHQLERSLLGGDSQEK